MTIPVVPGAVENVEVCAKDVTITAKVKEWTSNITGDTSLIVGSCYVCDSEAGCTNDIDKFKDSGGAVGQMNPANYFKFKQDGSVT